jgi:hypothetical protein
MGIVKMVDIEVGTRVRVNRPGSMHHNREGVVTLGTPTPSSHTVNVRLDGDDRELAFFVDSLEVIEGE